jgi:hypothetical protein
MTRASAAERHAGFINAVTIASFNNGCIAGLAAYTAGVVTGWAWGI